MSCLTEPKGLTFNLYFFIHSIIQFHMNKSTPHSFHIPVMGLGFTIDTPLKVARFGISSVVSIVEDELIEKMREFYCQKEGFPYSPITNIGINFREKRITAYLNLLDYMVKKQR